VTGKELSPWQKSSNDSATTHLKVPQDLGSGSLSQKSKSKMSNISKRFKNQKAREKHIRKSINILTGQQKDIEDKMLSILEKYESDWL
jgi:hypothetical protein